MKTGVFFQFGGSEDGSEDQRRIGEELRLLEELPGLGFDSVFGLEHHFTGYGMIPNVLIFLAHAAARTRLEVGSMVVVLPWHDPVRAAGEIALLDNLTGGRFILGIGRGLAQIEYEGFRIPMEQSRDRFIESTAMLVKALETGVAEYDGQYIKQPRRSIRPTPVRGFKGRTFMAAVSPSTMEIAARAGVGALIVVQKPLEGVAKELESYRDLYWKLNAEAPPSPMVSNHIFVDEDPGRAHELGHEFLKRAWRRTIGHYQTMGHAFDGKQGLEHYAESARKMRDVGEQAAVDAAATLYIAGTPEECFERIRAHQALLGSVHFGAVLNFGDMSFEEAQRNVRTFARTVRPRLQALPSTAPI